MMNSNVENKILNLLFGWTLITYVLGLGVYVKDIQIYLLPLMGFFFCSMFALLRRRRRSFVEPQYLIIWLMIVLVFIITMLSNFLNHATNLDYTVKMLILAILPMTLYIALKKQRNYELLMCMVLVSVAISALFAMAQTAKMQWAIDVWYNRFYSSTNERFGEIYNSLLGGRSAGLSSYSLNLAFQIVQVFPIGVILAQSTKGIKRVFYTIVSLICFFGVVASGTRAAVAICILELFVLFIPLKKVTRSLILKGIIGVFLIGLGSLYIISETDIFDVLIMRMNERGGGSISGRVQTIQHYLEVWWNGSIINYLFGFGYGTMNNYRGNVLGSGHNCIINALFQYGLFGLITAFILYAEIFCKLWKVKNTYMGRGLFVGLCGYLIMSLTNDSGLLDGDLFHIYYLSMLISFVFTYLNNIDDISKNKIRNKE